MTKAAVRIEDLAPLLQIQPLQAKPPTGAEPTAEEYAALLKDVSGLHARLLEIARRIQDRIL